MTVHRFRGASDDLNCHCSNLHSLKIGDIENCCELLSEKLNGDYGEVGKKRKSLFTKESLE